MADIFLSYAREDRKAAKMLAQALADQGWSVWWDQSIPPGKTWADVIGKQLITARSVLALWSKISVTKRWVLKEARFADQQGTLIPVRIEDVEPPFEFGDIQAADLTDWRGNLSHPGYKLLLEVMSDVLSVSPTAATEAPDATAAKRLAHLEPSVPPHHPVEPAEAGKRAPAERSKGKAPTEGQRTSSSTPRFHQKHWAALIGAVAVVVATGVITWQQLGKESPSTPSSPPTVVGDTTKPSVAPPSSEPTVEPDKPRRQGQPQPSATKPPREQYARAFAQLENRQYEAAGNSFAEFLKANPNDPLANNARYWLGETYYARGEFARSAELFLDVYAKDKTGQKAPDTLLKLGLSLSSLGKHKQACASFRELNRVFPNAPDAVKGRADWEVKRIGCP